jgi:hypothetical protein
MYKQCSVRIDIGCKSISVDTLHNSTTLTHKTLTEDFYCETTDNYTVLQLCQDSALNMQSLQSSTAQCSKVRYSICFVVQ